MIRVLAWFITVSIVFFSVACSDGSHPVKTDQQPDDDMVGTTDDLIDEEMTDEEAGDDGVDLDQDSGKDFDTPKDTDAPKDGDTPPVDEDIASDEDAPMSDNDIPPTDPCIGVSCSYHGTCKVDRNSNPYCDCDENYSPFGLECLPTANPCAPVTCSGHGACSLVNGEPTCTCDEGYVPEGLSCVNAQDPCAGILCSGHGTCVVTGNLPSCSCEEGYQPVGLECVSTTDPCNGVTCSGHGTCSVQNGLPACTCAEGFYAAGLYCVNQCTDAKGTIQQGKLCDDNIFCNGTDYCNASGRCIVHQYTDLNERCNDSNSCTADSCNEDLNMCENVPLTNTPCNDGLFCTTDDKCNSAGACVGIPIDCADTNECTLDSCQEKATGYECLHDNALPGTPCGDATETECDNADTCDGEGNCLLNLEPETTVCRDAAGACDVVEYCTGAHRFCPADTLAADTVECRPSAGSCDIAEFCTGNSPQCPDDQFKPSSAECRAATGECDLAEYCTGESADCPANQFKENTVVCRPSQGDCDAPETCTGNSAQCPADMKYGSNVVCRPAEDVCDIAETCPGNSNNCPADQVRPSTYICRPAVHPDCDITERCTGTAKTCPPDFRYPDGTDCEADKNLCTRDACLNGDCIASVKGAIREVSSNWPDDFDPIFLYNNGTCFDAVCDPETGSLSYNPFVTHSNGKFPVVCDTDGGVEPGDGFCQDIPPNMITLPEGCCKVCDQDDINGNCIAGPWESTCCLPIGAQKIGNACCIAQKRIGKVIFVANPSGECPSDGLKCTLDVCSESGFCTHLIKDGFCVIENRCYETDELNPDNPCEICQPQDDEASKVNWSALSDGTPCTTASGVKGACSSNEFGSFCIPL